MKTIISILAAFLISCSAYALERPAFWRLLGPPYDTDDPEPIELHHWEFYLASHSSHEEGGWEATAPHVEVNYGPASNLHLHFQMPVAFVSPSNGTSHYGLGDLEVGFKYRFIQESKSTPQVGIFPLIEVPTGNKDKELGSGEIQVFLPLWIQKTIGKFTTYGGGGYWINPGEGTKNWWYAGWLVQYQVNKYFNVGTELYHKTPQEIDGDSETRFNFGSVVNVTDHHHVLLSAGRGITGPVLFQGYIGYQYTL
jgi:hypothetical protein